MAEKLGAQLVRKGIIQQWQLEDALKVQREYGCRLGTNLVELEFIDVDALADNLGEQRKYPVAKPADFESVPDALLPLIPEKLADKHLAFPLAQDGRKLKVAFAAPYEPVAMDAIQFVTGLRIVPYIAPEIRMFFYLDRRYGIVRPARYIRKPERSGPVPTGNKVPPPPSITGGVGLFGSLKAGEFLSADPESGDDALATPKGPAPSSTASSAAVTLYGTPPWMASEEANAHPGRAVKAMASPREAPAASPTRESPRPAPVAAPLNAPPPPGHSAPSTSSAPAPAGSNSFTGTLSPAARRAGGPLPPLPELSVPGSSAAAVGAPVARPSAAVNASAAPRLSASDREGSRSVPPAAAPPWEMTSPPAMAAPPREMTPPPAMAAQSAAKSVRPAPSPNDFPEFTGIPKPSPTPSPVAAEAPPIPAQVPSPPQANPPAAPPPPASTSWTEADAAAETPDESLPTLELELETEDIPEPTPPVANAPPNGDAPQLVPTWEFVNGQKPQRPMIPLAEGEPAGEVPLSSPPDSAQWQPTAPEPPAARALSEMCAGCRGEQEIAMATLDYCAKQFSCGLYLVSRFGVAAAWRGFNLGEDSAAHALRIDISMPSIIQAAHNSGMAVGSPAPQTPMDQWIWQSLMPQNGLVVVKIAYQENADYLCVEIGSRSMVDVQKELADIQQIAVEAQLRLASSRGAPAN